MICRVPVVGAKDAIVDADMAELMLARKWMVAKRRSGLAYVADSRDHSLREQLFGDGK